ncbi:glycosyltransferase family 2 protein [Candidatus Saccharibacteria bacterium]|nr:glycosyltransferase family 2 protein [Candidatus Saccharibacteria bacterium]
MPKSAKSKPLLSVVLPSYNEEVNIPITYNELTKNIDTTKFDYQIIFVNDGSRDGTWSEIEKIARKDSGVEGLNFSRNFGHHAALEAGLQQAIGDVVIMMDADLQHPPSLIPKLIEEWEKGCDIVNTVRLSTEDAGLFKNVSSRLFYAFMNTFSDLRLKDGEADYRLISKRALVTLNSLPEAPKFYRGLINWIGYDVARVEYVAQARMHGKSSYTLKKMIELARLGLTSFSMKPLKIIITIGMALTALSLLALVVMIGVKLFVNPEYFTNNAILIMFLVLMTGVLTTFQGIIAVYLVDIFNEAKGRPTYIVKDITKKRDE